MNVLRKLRVAVRRKPVVLRGNRDSRQAFDGIATEFVEQRAHIVRDLVF
jgi:hypothetical protein